MCGFRQALVFATSVSLDSGRAHVLVLVLEEWPCASSDVLRTQS